MFADYQPRAIGDDKDAPPADLIIRHATHVDCSTIAALTAQREGLSQDQALQRATSALSKPTDTHLFLVAQSQSHVIGFAKAAYIQFDPPVPQVPHGWYLTGIIVDPHHRRRAIGSALTNSRLQWIARHASEVFYFANSLNRVSIELHQRLGFKEVLRDFKYPGTVFSGGGTGVLFRLKLE
jgi:ribosomal protein S18 acetylase RimI-like enzyme